MVRAPVFAGSFYTDNAAALRDQLKTLLANAKPNVPGRLRALVVPHAGYAYSAPIAASAYALLLNYKGKIDRVVLLGPSHRVGFSGFALPVETAFSTPLGPCDVDPGLRALLAGVAGVGEMPEAHSHEHSLEVQLPFLQMCLPGLPVLPLVVGVCTPEAAAAVLARLVKTARTLVVVSSDLSHYLPYAEAQNVDRQTADRVEALCDDIEPEEACGAYPLNGLLRFARGQGWKALRVDLRNSGDTCADRSKVVGYGAFAFVDNQEGLK